MPASLPIGRPPRQDRRLSAGVGARAGQQQADGAARLAPARSQIR